MSRRGWRRRRYDERQDVEGAAPARPARFVPTTFAALVPGSLANGGVQRRHGGDHRARSHVREILEEEIAAGARRGISPTADEVVSTGRRAT